MVLEPICGPLMKSRFVATGVRRTEFNFRGENALLGGKPIAREN